MGFLYYIFRLGGRPDGHWFISRIRCSTHNNPTVSGACVGDCCCASNSVVFACRLGACTLVGLWKLREGDWGSLSGASFTRVSRVFSSCYWVSTCDRLMRTNGYGWRYSCRVYRFKYSMNNWFLWSVRTWRKEQRS